jgi:hypothetical protein
MKNGLIRDKAMQIGKPLKGGGSDSILADLFHRIMLGIGINSHRFDRLMESYLNDPRNAIPQNIKDRSSARGNLRKELLKSAMSWKVFCKGLRFLNIRRFHINIKLEHANGDITSHDMVVKLADTDD